MTYQTVKNGIVNLIQGLGYQESNTMFDFEDAPSTEYENTFILYAKSGELEEFNAETLSDRFYDRQEWNLLVAFQKTGLNEIIEIDNLQRKREAILNELDNPVNWRSFVRIMKYKSWIVEDKESYFLLTIRLMVIDNIIYT